MARWHSEVWNEGLAPVFWVVSDSEITLYNGFGRPHPDGARANLLHTFELVGERLDELDALAGRLAMETGKFWLEEPRVLKRTSVDRQLLADLSTLETQLVESGQKRAEAQDLIGGTVFAQFLVDREIVDQESLRRLFEADSLSEILRAPTKARSLFEWLKDTFNGDVFGGTAPTTANLDHFSLVANFLDAVDPETGQTSLFPYRFEVIPVELISSIYEAFVHSGSQKAEAKEAGVYYTRLCVVSLVLDEVMDGIEGSETVVDLTCGSGVFLVEAFRRLVRAKATGSGPTRELIRSVLHKQIFGVDTSEAAVRVAAFSLYLAALELDPDPQPPEDLRFGTLIGSSLLIDDARTVVRTSREPRGSLKEEKVLPERLDIIVGNPPWSFRGRAGTASRRARESTPAPKQPRGEGLDFLELALDAAHSGTRIGLVLSAMPFFSPSRPARAAVAELLERIGPATLVNLAKLRDWLFPRAGVPAVVLLARHRTSRADLTVANVPWSPIGERTHTFEIAPSDLRELNLSDWIRQPGRFKAATTGSLRDVGLLSRLDRDYESLDSALNTLDAKFRDGLILGSVANRTRSVPGSVQQLPYLESRDLRPLEVPSTLPLFHEPSAQWPRDESIYRAPVLLVKEFLLEQFRGPVVAISSEDLVYSDAYFGASFGRHNETEARLVAGILSSALATWYVLLTGGEFGLCKRRLLLKDILHFPVPDLTAAAGSEPGRRILRLVEDFQRSPGDYRSLDEAVGDLYELTESERVLVDDGLRKAGWEWKKGRAESIAPATDEDLRLYTETFLAGMDRWLALRGRQRFSAQLFTNADSWPIRVVSLRLEERPGPSRIASSEPDARMSEVLDRLGRRLEVPLGSTLRGQRELRVHGEREMAIVKPAMHRFWMRSAALNDVDSVVQDSVEALSS